MEMPFTGTRWFNGSEMKCVLSIVSVFTQNVLTTTNSKNSGQLSSFCQDCSLKS